MTTRFLVGRAVPYGTRTPIYEPEIGAYYETFQRGSLTADVNGSTVPLLMEHIGSQPLGRLRRVWDEADGMWAEAQLAGRTDEIEDLVSADVVRGLSVGFIIDRRSDKWTRAADGLPHVTRHNSKLKELSLTWRPTYEAATITGVSEHSTQHAESQRVLVEMKLWRQMDRVRQARTHGTRAG